MKTDAETREAFEVEPAVGIEESGVAFARIVGSRAAFDRDLDLLQLLRRRRSALDAQEAEVVARLSRRAWGMSVGVDAEASAVGQFACTAQQKRELFAEIGAVVRLPEATVSSMVSDAETLVTSLPRTLAALHAGDVSQRHAHIMVAQCSTLPMEAHSAFEVALLPAAGRLTAAQFAHRARVVRERVHPDSSQRRHVEALERRGVWIDPRADGMAQLSWLLPAAEAIAIDDKLDQIAHSQRGADEVRTHAQRRCDAAVALVLHPDGALAGVAATVRPQVILTVPALSMLGHTDEPAELHGYGPIDPQTARRLTAQAPSVTRWLTDPVTGDTLSVGRRNYRIPNELRLALIVEDETCRFPGCRRRAERCELDHVRAWAHGGETSQANLASLCPRHHHLKHESDWAVEALPGRRLRWTSPLGRHHTTEPANENRPPWRERPPIPPPPQGAPRSVDRVATARFGSRPPARKPAFHATAEPCPLPDEPPF
jgi:hypothetical protein